VFVWGEVGGVLRNRDSPGLFIGLLAVMLWLSPCLGIKTGEVSSWGEGNCFLVLELIKRLKLYSLLDLAKARIKGLNNEQAMGQWKGSLWGVWAILNPLPGTHLCFGGVRCLYSHIARTPPTRGYVDAEK
jgi:hypothetical protein